MDVASPQPSHPPPIFSRAVRNYFALPDHRRCPEAFIDALNRLIHEHQFDMLIPSTDSALIAVSPYYEMLRSKLYVSCPPPSIVRQVLDKRITLQAGKECGLRTPRVFDIEYSCQSHDGEDLAWLPLVAKPAEKFGGENPAIRYFHGSRELYHAFMEEPDFGAKYLLQEYCEGEGIGVTVLLWDDEPRALFQHRRIKELPVHGGVSTLAEAQRPDPKLVEQSVALLRRLGWQGIAMVEFRYNRDTGEATLMEVNGRYWGSLALAVRAGMDFPLYEWQLAHGLNPDVPGRYDEGLKMLWRAGDAGRLAEMFQSRRDSVERSTLLRESIRFCRDILSTTPDAVWSASDPLPAFAEVYAKIKNTVRRGCAT